MSRKIESQLVVIQRNPEHIFDFLSNFDHFNHLLPEQVLNWKSAGEECSFEVKGLATIGLRIVEKIPFTLINMKGEGRIPFPFSFNIHIKKKTETQSEVQIIALAEMNPFIAMMAEKPLANLVDEIVTRLKIEMEK